VQLTYIEEGSFLTLHYRLSGPNGQHWVNTFGEKPATLSMGAGQLAPAMEARLLGLAQGEQASFELAPSEAFGEHNPGMVQRVKRSLLQDLGNEQTDYAVGDMVQFPTPSGQAAYGGVVREVHPDWLLFDFNHPLAGQPVSFEVHIIGVLP
jgi:FKBP-type peptidyl-prolyl cis-trans isomerase SlpA